MFVWLVMFRSNSHILVLDILIEAIRENEVVIDKKELQLLELTETLKMLAPHYS
jgi:hypothetical protein